MIMGRGHLEDSDGNIITDPNIIKEQLTGPSIDGAISMGWEKELLGDLENITLFMIS